MKTLPFGRVVLFATFIATLLFGSLCPAEATGTATITHPDGTISTYTNVHIIIWNESLAFTSSDGQGTVVLGKAACTKTGDLVECLPWDATIFQNGNKVRIPLESGTIWLNPTNTMQSLSHSSTELPPRGVLLAVKTRRGTYVNLTGIVDEVHR
jgi:hypothetical protein